MSVTHPEVLEFFVPLMQRASDPEQPCDPRTYQSKPHYSSQIRRLPAGRVNNQRNVFAGMIGAFGGRIATVIRSDDDVLILTQPSNEIAQP